MEEEEAAAAPEERPPRFECPANFAPCPFSPGPAFSQETLQSPSKQLWLIRAPANFSPESLDGHTVPLLGSQMLKVPQPDGTQKVYSFQAAPGDLDSAHLLIPSGRRDHLMGAPSFSGSLSVCERYGDPSCNQLLFPVAARLAPQVPAGLRQRFLPFGGHPQSPPLREAAEGPPRRRRKKKKHQLHSVGYMGDAAEQGSQLSSHREGSSQESLFSGGVAEPSLKSKKKQLKEEEELPPLVASSQAQQSDLEPWVPGAEGLGLCKPQRRRRRQREEEAAAPAMAAPPDIATVKEEAEGGHWDFRGPGATLEDSLPSGRRKKRKKEKVLAKEPPPWEQGAAVSGGGEELGTRCGPGTGVEEQPLLPGAEGRSRKHKKKKKHKRAAAAEEESWPS